MVGIAHSKQKLRSLRENDLYFDRIYPPTQKVTGLPARIMAGFPVDECWVGQSAVVLLGRPSSAVSPCYGGWKGGYASAGLSAGFVAGSAEECGGVPQLRVGLHRIALLCCSVISRTEMTERNPPDGGVYRVAYKVFDVSRM